MKTILQKDADIAHIAKELKKGKTIIYPTETCYGLGCDGTNQKAVDTIFSIKQRQKEKPLPLSGKKDFFCKYTGMLV